MTKKFWWCHIGRTFWKTTFQGAEKTCSWGVMSPLVLCYETIYVVKIESCQRKVQTLPLALGMHSLRPWNVLSYKSSFFFYHIGLSSNVKYVGNLGHVIFAQPPQRLKTKVSYKDGQLCLCDPIKSMDIKVWMNFPKWQNTHRILSYIIAGRSEQ